MINRIPHGKFHAVVLIRRQLRADIRSGQYQLLNRG
jgi:hypothetical protein